jgi:hypothetical protein
MQSRCNCADTVIQVPLQTRSHVTNIYSAHRLQYQSRDHVYITAQPRCNCVAFALLSVEGTICNKRCSTPVLRLVPDCVVFVGMSQHRVLIRGAIAVRSRGWWSITSDWIHRTGVTHVLLQMVRGGYK